MAGLNFVGNAVYAAIKPDVENIAQFEFIPWILSQCSSLVEVRELLERINIVNTPFSEQLPLAQLHWIISDENESITVESMSDGLHIICIYLLNSPEILSAKIWLLMHIVEVWED